ncbi:MAG TPA: Holliday junction resolvase RuvX [Ktedonobacteraceae bacterium]|nr:Holliday junction resolvase RuvX [Ktedonobacteraceae bacterium]HYB00586.1 Holliday junction resolvase RuvX [Ktedonobacteraceae bacterium]
MAVWLALDVGDVRIGVAISDATGFLASPYTTLHVTRNEAQTWSAIERLIEETGAEGLVVGLPISLDGALHSQGRRVQAFADRLREHITVPIVFWDERLSTIEAERLLTERGGPEPVKRNRTASRRKQGQSKRRHKKQEIDALAAAVILQEYLDAHASKTKGT